MGKKREQLITITQSGANQLSPPEISDHFSNNNGNTMSKIFASSLVSIQFEDNQFSGFHTC